MPFAIQPGISVGLIHWAFPPTTGGVESHLADLARLLVDAGCRVTVITGEAEPIRSPDYAVECASSLRLAGLREHGEGRVQRFTELREEFRRLIAAHRLSVLHGHNLHHFSAWPALALEDLRKECGFRMYHTFHETWPDVLHDTPVYRNWDGNYAVSMFVQNQCHQLLGFRPRLLRLGVDPSRFRPRRAPFRHGGTAVILHPARLLPWKGVHVSVRMLADLRSQGWDVKLVVTDTPLIADWNQELRPYRNEIMALISTLGVREFVEFRSPAYSEMAAVYEEADVVVYPTTGDEPYGLVPLEAMSCGRPVVVSSSGGMAETVIDGKTGFVVARGDVAALGERTSALLADPDLARRFGAAGRELIERKFHMRQYVAALVRDYQSKVALHGS